MLPHVALVVVPVAVGGLEILGGEDPQGGEEYKAEALCFRAQETSAVSADLDLWGGIRVSMLDFAGSSC